MFLPNSYKRLLRLPEEALVPVGERTITLSDIEGGILFVLAKWSGASQLSFRSLNAVLGELSDFSKLRLFIADADSEATQRFMENAGDIPSGSGETYWIKGGRLLGKLRCCNESDREAIRDYTHRVLAQAASEGG